MYKKNNEQTEHTWNLRAKQKLHLTFVRRKHIAFNFFLRFSIKSNFENNLFYKITARLVGADNIFFCL